MAIKDVLPQLRRDRGLTQQELAAKLYVTRQAVSRWETGETEPGIDMTKLLAVALDVPVSVLLEMPGHFCQSCGMPIADPAIQGTEADGSLSPDYCNWCYANGTFTYEIDMDDMIERCAPFMMESTHLSRDEAVSVMGAILPTLKRWKGSTMTKEQELAAAEAAFGKEARERYGDAVDETNARLQALSDDEWEAKKLLEESIKVQLRIAMAGGDAHSEASAELARMHERWIRMHWGGNYNRDAHLGLARGYLCDGRFTGYYDGACGAGATQFLVDALEANL